MFLLSALIVGFLGSFHCVGMCGPIALALPTNDRSRMGFIYGRFLYNLGRITTYSILGLIVGLAGHSIALAGFQKTVSIASGVIILGVVLLPLISSKLKINGLFIYQLTSKIKILFKKLFTLKSKYTLYWIGGVNGLLPCGFVYLALMYSFNGTSKWDGMFYMFSFGLGTLPMMFGLSMTGKVFNGRFHPYIRKATPYIAVIMAAFLIGRGLLIQNQSCCHH